MSDQEIIEVAEPTNPARVVSADESDNHEGTTKRALACSAKQQKCRVGARLRAARAGILSDGQRVPAIRRPWRLRHCSTAKQKPSLARLWRRHWKAIWLRCGSAWNGYCRRDEIVRSYSICRTSRAFLTRSMPHLQF